MDQSALAMAAARAGRAIARKHGSVPHFRHHSVRGRLAAVGPQRQEAPLLPLLRPRLTPSVHLLEAVNIQRIDSRTLSFSTMATKRITVEGVGGVKLSSDAELDKWLSNNGVECLLDSGGYEVGGFESLVHGETYKLGPPHEPPPANQRELQTPKRIIIVDADGEERKVSMAKEAGYTRLLAAYGVRFLVYKDKIHIRDFESLVGGETYTLGPPYEREPPPAKRQHKLQTWGEIQDSVKPPTEVPPPVLVEGDTPPAFVSPEGWLDGLCKEVKVQFDLEETQYPRVAPVAVVRCSCGGKTRALHELAWALPLTLQKDNEPGTAIIYVSFNGHTQLLPWEKEQPLEALCRRIIYVARGGKPSHSAFNKFADETEIKKEDVKSWLGDAKCVLIIDELNLVEDTINEDFASFLKFVFLLPAGRALVFSSHVLSVTSTLTRYMHSPSNREVRVKKLPLIPDLFKTKESLKFPELSPHQALYLGLIPALCYCAKLNHLPHQRRLDAIQKYLDSGVTPAKVEVLLGTMLTGEYALVPKVFRELMDIDVIEMIPIAIWIPYHMSQVLLTLSSVEKLSPSMRGCLSAIHEQFERFRSHKTQPGDGWEALFIVTLLTRCLTKRFCKLVPLYGFDGDVSWNLPLKPEVEFDCELVQQFIDGIPLRGKANSISIYSPTHAKFKTYDVILACWDEDGKRHLYGYQLREGGTVPKQPAMDQFARSYLVRGQATTKDSSIRRWTTPSDETLDAFFGLSAKNWTPKCWAELRNSSSLPAVPLGNGESR